MTEKNVSIKILCNHPTMSSHDAVETSNVVFNPPLWMQRRSMVNRIILDLEVSEVVDIGCGEGSLIEIMINNDSMHHLIGIDVDESVVQLAKECCKPLPYHLSTLRPNPMHVEIVQGNLATAQECFKGRECMTAVEVIEHLYPDTLKAFEENVFGIYKPRVVVITTPNAEFNVYFDPKGFFNGKYRHDDHKFEWTRQEFEQWANRIAAEHGYQVKFTGMGFKREDVHSAGPCTQAAIFVSNSVWKKQRTLSLISMQSFAEHPRSASDNFFLVAYHNYPCFDRSKISDNDILQAILDYISEELKYSPDKFSSPISLDSLFDVWTIHRYAGSKEKLKEVLKSKPNYFRLIHNQHSDSDTKQSAWYEFISENKKAELARQDFIQVLKF